MPSIACIRMASTCPMHAEATKHVQLGCKSLGCPAALCAAVGTIGEASKIGGLNITEYLQPRKTSALKSFKRKKREADPMIFWGRPMTRRKKQVNALRGTAGVEDQASKERFSEITLGKSHGQQGLVITCKDSSNEARNRRRGESGGIGA
jgi:hypothetical protein